MPVFRRPSLVWPFAVIGLGAVTLLQTLGWLPASLWAALAQLWPVLLILVGLHLLVGRHWAFGPVVVVGAGVVLVAGSLTWAALRASQLPPGDAQSVTQSPEGAEWLSLTLNVPTAELHVSALGRPGGLLEAVVQNGPGETVRQTYAVSGGEGRLVLEQSVDPLLAPFLARRVAERGGVARWDVRLAPRLPLALAVNAEAGPLTLDLAGLQLTGLDLTSGLGQTVVSLPAGPAAHVRVSTGLGPATLNLPAGMPVRLTVRSGLAQVSLPPGLALAGGAYTTPGFDASKPFLDLALSAGLGGVTLR